VTRCHKDRVAGISMFVTQRERSARESPRTLQGDPHAEPRSADRAGLLAVVFLLSSAKLFVPKEKIAGMSAATRWVEDFSPGALKAIGALELLAAAGLILPAALDIAPVLVPLTATC
jgi:hypothetical protein